MTSIESLPRASRPQEELQTPEQKAAAFNDALNRAPEPTAQTERGALIGFTFESELLVADGAGDADAGREAWEKVAGGAKK